MVLFLDESPWGASVLLSPLWEVLRAEAGPEGAHGPAHRRETVRLRALWQGIRTPPLPTHPPPPSLQQNDLHTASKGREVFHSALLNAPCLLVGPRSVYPGPQSHQRFRTIPPNYMWMLDATLCCNVPAKAEKKKSACKHGWKQCCS